MPRIGLGTSRASDRFGDKGVHVRIAFTVRPIVATVYVPRYANRWVRSSW